MNVVAVSGTRTRYDVGSKCRAVAAVLERTYPSKKALNARISSIAESMEVNPVTIKAWIAKYNKTYRLGQTLPKGTMTFAFNVVEEQDIPTINTKLSNIRAMVHGIRVLHESSAIDGYNAADLRTRNTPKEILDELVETRKGE